MSRAEESRIAGDASPRHERRGESGVALVTLVFVMLVLGVIAVGLAELASTAAYGALESSDSTQAAFAAEAGLAMSVRTNSLAPTPVPFGGATFTVDELSTNPVTVRATGAKGLATRRVSSEHAFAYVPRSRVANTDDDVEFLVKNVTGAARTLTALRLTWGGATAFAEEARLRVLGGTNHGIVWIASIAGGDRLASGEVGTFNTGGPPVAVPADATVRVRLLRFRSAETGAATPVDMDATAFRADFRAGAQLFAESTVRVSGW